jgi:hypothetical protein
LFFLNQAWHRRIHIIKQEILAKSITNGNVLENIDENSAESRSENIDRLFQTLHLALVECQRLGDQKIRLTSQIIETITNKTRQLGFDNKNNGKLCLSLLKLKLV